MLSKPLFDFHIFKQKLFLRSFLQKQTSIFFLNEARPGNSVFPLIHQSKTNLKMLLTVIWELFAVRTENNKTRLLFPFSQRFSSACLTLTYPRHTDAHQLIFSLHPPAPPPPTPPPPIFPSPYFTFLIHSYILHTAVISARRYARPDSPPAVTGT